jgi:hypothetical protein
MARMEAGTMGLTPVRYSHDADAFEWALHGSEGAVTFHVFPDDRTRNGQIACCLGIHARKKLSTLPKLGRCDVLPEGRCYEQVKLHGAYELWVLSSHGRDGKLIREMLEGLYRSTFA